VKVLRDAGLVESSRQCAHVPPWDVPDAVRELRGVIEQRVSSLPP